VTAQSTGDDRTIKPFGAVLQELDKGRVHTRLSELLTQLVAAVVDTGKKGSLTLQLVVEPNKDDVTYTVSPKVKLASPEEERGTLFFADDDGNLTRTDPRQQVLPLSLATKDTA
jgi:hypothetical protein